MYLVVKKERWVCYEMLVDDEDRAKALAEADINLVLAHEHKLDICEQY